MVSILKFLRDSWKISMWLVLVGGLMTAAMAASNDWSTRTVLNAGAITILIWLMLWLGNGYISEWLDDQMSWHERPGLRFAAGIAAMLVYSMGAVYFLILFFRHVVGFDPGDDLDGWFYSTLLITILISMFLTARAFLFNWKQAAVDAEQLKRESIRAQYESLRSQVNPHFLFNSLNALTNLIHRNPDEAVQFIKQLADVYRYVLETRDKELVSIGEELKFLHAYLFLQQIRFGDKLKLEVKVPDNGQVAPLALQMLVENAIKHNVIAEDHPLSVSVFGKDGYVWVSNNLQRKPPPGEGSAGLGLENIRRRYGFLSGQPIRVVEHNGVFEVGLPLLTS